jgi:hypothetical protein
MPRKKKPTKKPTRKKAPPRKTTRPTAPAESAPTTNDEWQGALAELESVLHLLTPQELARAKALLTPNSRARLDSMPLQAVEMELAAMNEIIRRRGIDPEDWRRAWDEEVDEAEILPLLPAEYRPYFARMYQTNRWEGPVDGPWPEGTTLGKYEYYDQANGWERSVVLVPTPEFAEEYRALYDWLRANRHWVSLPAGDELLAGHYDAMQLTAGMPDDPRSPFAAKYAAAVRGLKARYGGGHNP